MITLTKNMLDKSIIDCNNACRAFAAKIGIDYDEMKNGDKIVIEAKWPDGSPSEIRYYKPANDRKDRRISIKDIKAHCEAGDTISMSGTLKSATIRLHIS